MKKTLFILFAIFLFSTSLGDKVNAQISCNDPVVCEELCGGIWCEGICYAGTPNPCSNPPTFTDGLGKGFREPCSPYRELNVFGADVGGALLSPINDWNCLPAILEPTTSFNLSTITPYHEVTAGLIVGQYLWGGQGDYTITTEYRRASDNFLIVKWQKTYSDPGAGSYYPSYKRASAIGYVPCEIIGNGQYYLNQTVSRGGQIIFTNQINFTITGVNNPFSSNNFTLKAEPSEVNTGQNIGIGIAACGNNSGDPTMSTGQNNRVNLLYAHYGGNWHYCYCTPGYADSCGRVYNTHCSNTWTTSESSEGTYTYTGGVYTAETDWPGKWYYTTPSNVSVTVKSPTCSSLSFPTDKWQRVWYDSSWNCLGDGPHETNIDFDYDPTPVYGRSDNIIFKSSRSIYFSTTGPYKIVVGSDDGKKLWIDDSLVVDDWNTHSYSDGVAAFSITLNAGWHNFELHYFEATGSARVSFDRTHPQEDVDCNTECARRGYPRGDCELTWIPWCNGYYGYYSDTIGNGYTVPVLGECKSPLRDVYCFCCHTCPATPPISGSATVGPCSATITPRGWDCDVGEGGCNSNVRYRCFNKGAPGVTIDKGWGDPGCIRDINWGHSNWVSIGMRDTPTGTCYRNLDFSNSWSTAGDQITVTTQINDKDASHDLDAGHDISVSGTGCWGFRRIGQDECIGGLTGVDVVRNSGSGSRSYDMEWCGDGECNCGEQGTNPAGANYCPTDNCCVCSTTTVGGCCDGCNYCPAGKVFNGTSCVDATETVRCNYQNVCTAGSCSGYVKNRECKAGGVCDDTDTYYTTTDKYASAGKVLTSSCTDQDATSQALACDSDTNYWCTAGNCSGYYRYSECKTDHICDTAATTNYYQINVTASAGKVLSATCTDQDAASAIKCAATVNNCANGSCSGQKKYPECQAGGVCDSTATTYYTSEIVYADAGSTLTSTCETTGTTNCDTNICWDGGGHHEKCDRRCNASHTCDYYNCTNHCINTVKDCDETGVDCGGSCLSCDVTPPTTNIKVKRKSTGEDLTAAGSWLRADTYTITFEDHDQADGSGLNCENCSCEYSIYSCDVGGINCNTAVVSLTSRTPNSSFDIVAGKTAATYNLEGVGGRYRIYSGAKDMANQSATEYRYINFDFTAPRTEIR